MPRSWVIAWLRVSPRVWYGYGYGMVLSKLKDQLWLINGNGNVFNALESWSPIYDDVWYLLWITAFIYIYVFKYSVTWDLFSHDFVQYSKKNIWNYNSWLLCCVWNIFVSISHPPDIYQVISWTIVMTSVEDDFTLAWKSCTFMYATVNIQCNRHIILYIGDQKSRAINTFPFLFPASLVPIDKKCPIFPGECQKQAAINE